MTAAKIMICRIKWKVDPSLHSRNVKTWSLYAACIIQNGSFAEPAPLGLRMTSSQRVTRTCNACPSLETNPVLVILSTCPEPVEGSEAQRRGTLCVIQMTFNQCGMDPSLRALIDASPTLTRAALAQDDKYVECDKYMGGQDKRIETSPVLVILSKRSVAKNPLGMVKSEGGSFASRLNRRITNRGRRLLRITST